ncbi:MAG TPA: methyltransferase, partial [Mariprofundaceae bacterium]|nr:methyltransferase [Mariprofundaceae bacterium]
PAAGDKDVYLACALFHGLSDADSIRILRNIRAASQADVAIFEAVVPEQGASLMFTAFDMQMLMGTDGKERTAKEWQALCSEAGYRIAGTYDTRSLWNLQMLQPA